MFILPILIGFYFGVLTGGAYTTRNRFLYVMWMVSLIVILPSILLAIHYLNLRLFELFSLLIAVGIGFEAVQLMRYFVKGLNSRSSSSIPKSDDR